MKYKFKIGNTSITDDKIDKHKDFKKLKANYDKQVAPLYKKPLYKDPKALIVVLIILLLTYLIVEAYQKDAIEEHKMEKNDNKIVVPNGDQEKEGKELPAKDSIKYPARSDTKSDSIKKIESLK